MPKRKNTFGDSAQPKRSKVDLGETHGSAHNRSPQPIPSQAVTSKQPEQSPVKSRLQRKGKVKGATTTVTNAAQPLMKATIKATPNSSHRGTMHKLAPPRPFPTVPYSTSANGPKSAHKEGKNLICVTRHTTLATYLRRCKNILVDDGYQILHLHAMGAAIPHLLTLSVSLPPILPFAGNEIKIEVRTGTINVMDEIIPEDEDEDMSLRTRDKGGVSVVIQIRDGKERAPAVAKRNQPAKQAKVQGKKPEVLIVQEQDQEDEMDQERDGLGTDN